MTIKQGRKELRFSTGSSIAGRSWDDLLASINKEEACWKELLGGELPMRPNHQPFGNAVDFGHLRTVVQGLRSNPTAESAVDIMPLVIGNRPQMLPPRYSRVAQLIKRLITSNRHNSAHCVILAFWFEENLADLSSTQHNIILNGQYYHGLSLLVSVQTGLGAILNEDVLTAGELAKARLDALAASNGHISEAFGTAVAEMSEAASAERDQISKNAEQTQLVLDRWRKVCLGKATRYAKEWDDKFASAYEAYVKLLQFEAPIKLWSDRAKEHEKSALWNLVFFVAAAAFAAFGSMFGFLTYGHTIAASFVRDICPPAGGPCTSGLSAEGPLATAAILFSASLMLWVLRLVYRVYLSHRHLALGARERQAFTQAYLAFIKDNVMAPDQVAIVLASLFRPSQDGIVKDDDSGVMDISAASIIAKALAGR